MLKKLSRIKIKELKLQQILMSDLKKQFKKLIRTNGIYFINEFFRWNKFFQSKKLFRLKKIYQIKKVFQIEKNFQMEKTFLD